MTSGLLPTFYVAPLEAGGCPLLSPPNWPHMVLTTQDCVMVEQRKVRRGGMWGSGAGGDVQGGEAALSILSQLHTGQSLEHLSLSSPAGLHNLSGRGAVLRPKALKP